MTIETGFVDLATARKTDLCRTYWGSHGCDLDPKVQHEVHQCGRPSERYGLLSRYYLCSQMRKVTTDGPGGKAEVRFWYHDEPPRWGDWSADWTWFV